ncbi:MAG: peptidoglycan bridge formation glycyltransferase FemA/FemB family protein [bacterium]
MEVKEITDKNILEGFLREQKEKTFLQSWNWGEFQEKMGNKIWRLGVYNEYNNGYPISIILVVKITARRGTFLLVQHGPITKISNFQFPISKHEILKVLLEKLKKIGKEEGAVFIRVAPLLERTEDNKKLFQELGFRNAPMHASAYEASWKLDISLSEEELLANMRKTTRYLIRQASNNKDISIEKSENLDNIETYQKLNEEVAKRQRFTPFSYQYTKNEFEVFAKDNQALLFFGKYKPPHQKFGSGGKEEIAAAALIIFWSGIGFYHQAASKQKYAKLSLPYLLQWEAIKEAKKRGCSLYDFWGYVDPKENPKHPWSGPTLFKMGFGGKAFQYVKTQDLPLSKKYWLTYFFEKIRKAKRGL